MEARSWLACIGFVAAFFAGALLCTQVAASLQKAARSMRSLRMQGDPDADLAGRSVLLRNGITLFAPVARGLLRMKPVKRYSELLLYGCRLLDWPATAEGVLSVVVALVIALALAGMVAGSPLFGAIAAICLLLIIGFTIKRQQESEQEHLRDDVPLVLRSMSACFHSGYTLLQTFQQVAAESEGKVSGYFERAASGMETGKTVSQVLEELRRDAMLPELGFVIVALEVQHRTGGSLRHVIDSACDAVNEELALKRSLRVQTAQARLSARVVTAMPFVLLAILTLITQDFLEPFFASPMGIALLVVALSMQAAGVVTVRKMLEVSDE